MDSYGNLYKKQEYAMYYAQKLTERVEQFPDKEKAQNYEMFKTKTIVRSQRCPPDTGQ